MIIVTGLPRSGTQWAAWVLNELGVKAQHEGITWSDKYVPEIPKVDAVSSWALAPVVSDGDNVFSMRRPKGEWLNSMLTSKVAKAWSEGAPWVEFARHNLGVTPANWADMSPEDRALVLFENWPEPGVTLRPGTKKAVHVLAEAAGVTLTGDEIDRLAAHVVDAT